MPRPVSRSGAYFPGLDGLRVIAVALVIAYHVGVPHMGGGLLGVGVFFTLSGYLITSLLITSWHRQDAAGLARFWRRRIRRLLPAVALLLSAVLIATAVTRPSKLYEWGGQALAALFYIANWATIAKGDTYFNRFEGPSPFEHLWSLSVEEQFYIVWPLILLVMLLIFHNRIRLVGFITLLLGCVSMVELAMLYNPGADATRVYEGTDTRAGGLLWGAALALLWHPLQSSRVSGMFRIIILDVLGILGIVGIIGLSCWTDETSSFLYRGGIALLTIATCLVLVAVTHPATFTARLLGLTPLRWLGERTYGIYLWHMPLAAFLPARTFYSHTVLRALIVIVPSLILASASWSIVENPIRKYGVAGAWKQQTRSRATGSRTRRRMVPTFISGGVVIGLTATAALAGTYRLPQISVEQIAKQAAATTTTTAPKPPTSGKAPAIAYPMPGRPLKTSCSTVAHIGDSTSLGFSDSSQTDLTVPTQRIRAQYQTVGVHTVIEDIKGARSIVEHFKSDTNGIEAVQAHVKSMGTNGCFVIALGMNDAATMSLGGTPITAPERIDRLMKAAVGRRVLWVTAVTQAWASLPGYQNTAMQKFNGALMEATKRWPNLRIYDWSSEALPHPQWFLQDDANHNNASGSREKSRRIAEALAVAFPANTSTVNSKVVRTSK